MVDERLQDLLIKCIKRLEKVEADMISIKAYIENQKSYMIENAKRFEKMSGKIQQLEGRIGGREEIYDEKKQEKKEEEELSEETKMRNIEYETLKSRIGDL